MRPWSQQFHFFVMDHGGAVVRGYATSVDDVLAEDVDVAVVDDVTSFLSIRAIERLHEHSIAVVGMYDEADAETGKWRLLELGVDGVLPTSAPPEALLVELVRVYEKLHDSSNRRPLAGSEDISATGPVASGRLVTVCSAAGASGATEVAIAITREMRPSGGVILVDADDQSPGLAARLRLPLQPNLRSAIDAVLHRVGSLDDCVHRASGHDLAVLPGLPGPAEWSKLRADAVIEVLRALRREHGMVVANVGPRIEALPGDGPVARFGVARAVVAASSAIVVVSTASVGGVRRLIEWAVEAKALVEDAAVHAVLNRHAGGRFIAGELVEEFAAAWPVASVTVAPFDPRVARAEWDGTGVDRGPFTRALLPVAAAVGGP